MSPIARFAIPMLLLAATGAGHSADFDAAAYHQAECTRCHGTEVYTRDNRRVQSFPMLQAQVERCDANLAKKLFPEDLAQLVDYLNDNYYKFNQ